MKKLLRLWNWLACRYFGRVVNLGRSDHFRPGQTCIAGGKYLRVSAGRVVAYSIDMREGRQFPPGQGKNETYVLYEAC